MVDLDGWSIALVLGGHNGALIAPVRVPKIEARRSQELNLRFFSIFRKIQIVFLAGVAL